MRTGMGLTAVLAWCAATAAAQPPVPSTWQGEAVGRIGGAAFRVPIEIQLGRALPYEANPFHLSAGSGEVARVGDVLLVSATQLGAGGGGIQHTGGRGVGIYTERRVPHSATVPQPGGATLQYLTVTQQGPVVTGVLTAVNADAAAAINGFTGPNVSAQEAGDVMRGVTQSLGPTELFTFLEGATLRLRFEGASVTGSIEGKGRSVLNTSSDVAYECRITARQVK